MARSDILPARRWRHGSAATPDAEVRLGLEQSPQRDEQHAGDRLRPAAEGRVGAAAERPHRGSP
eukprot:5369543-Pyramimonas_sp.AAC.1